MAADLRVVSTRRLASELVSRAPHLIRSRLQRGRRTRSHGSNAAFDRTSFDVLHRPNDPPVELWSGYRSRIKARWPKFFWPVRVLLDLRERIALPEQLEALAGQIREGHTLPVSLPEIVELLKPTALQHPQHVRQADIVDSHLQDPMLAMVPTEKDVSSICQYYVSHASRILARLGAHGFRPEGSRALEVGCGRGYMTYALSALGFAEAIGLDRDVRTYYTISEQGRVRAAMLPRNGRSPTTRIQEGDASAIPFPDEYFDLVHSTSVLEHIADLRAAFQEMHRVLKPDGLAYHGVDPWFSPAGGHSMCTLDFPWGHVRLSADEFADYLSRYRPYESAQALDFYGNSFQTPRLTIDEVQSLVIDGGFEIVLWEESNSAFVDHYPFLDRSLLAECRSHYPSVTVGDLVTNGYTMLLRKR